MLYRRFQTVGGRCEMYMTVLCESISARCDRFVREYKVAESAADFMKIWLRALYETQRVYTLPMFTRVDAESLVEWPEMGLCMTFPDRCTAYFARDDDRRYEVEYSTMVIADLVYSIQFAAAAISHSIPPVV